MIAIYHIPHEVVIPNGRTINLCARYDYRAMEMQAERIQEQIIASKPTYIHTPSFGFRPLPAVRSFADWLFPGRGTFT